MLGPGTQIPKSGNCKINQQINKSADQQMTSVRLDVWLDVTCLFKTRSEAQKACDGGKVEVNGQAAKPHRLLRVGDEIRITRLHGRRQIVVVQELAERHVPKAEARAFYEDRTPPPTPEELEMIELDRAMRRSFGSRPARAPDKRERRALRKLKGQ
ncbi:MAG: RNA-binding S4 domain-containing protein [Acidobacteria bacterium]|nr:MAG: RNA-binding S4 domain-containing protein [Acidobacteriota bacterium]